MTLSTINTIIDYGKQIFNWITGAKDRKIKKQVKEVLDEVKRTRNLDRANKRISR